MNVGKPKPPSEMSDGEIDAAILAQYEVRDAATNMADLTCAHRRLRSLQREAANRIEARFRATHMMPPKDGSPDLLARVGAILKAHESGDLAKFEELLNAESARAR